MSSPKFFRLANVLHLYQGAFRAQLEQENSTEGSGPPGAQYEDERFTHGETMTMAEALAKGSGDDTDRLKALSKEGENSQFGPLFEYETA